MKWIIVLVLFSSLSADPAVRLVPTVEQFLPMIHGSSVRTHPLDSRYGIDLEPIWRAMFRAIAHRDPSVHRGPESQTGTELSGAFRFNPQSRTLTLTLYLYENGSYRDCSREIDFTGDASKVIPDFHSRFDGGIEEQRNLYRGRAVDRLLQMALAGKVPSLLRKNRAFRITNPEVIRGDWKLQIFLEQLSSQFGTKFTTLSDHTLTFDPSGSVVFANSHERQFLTSILPAKKSVAAPVQFYFAPLNSGVSFESTPISSSVEKSMCSEITQYVERDYPKLFAPLDETRLIQLFDSPDQPSVVVGAVDSEESVRYRWVTPREWVRSLSVIALKNRTFKVSCSVNDIVQDPHNPQRFWVIANQMWQTFDPAGNERYRDSGYLLLNMDFSASGTLVSVNVHYRIWIYQYPVHFRQEVSSGQALLRSDIDRIFYSIKGVDSSLKEQVKQSILENH